MIGGRVDVRWVDWGGIQVADVGMSMPGNKGADSGLTARSARHLDVVFCTTESVYEVFEKDGVE